MLLEFDWDPEKARSNYQKHKISFIEAASIFSDPFAGHQFLDLVHPHKVYAPKVAVDKLHPEIAGQLSAIAALH